MSKKIQLFDKILSKSYQLRELFPEEDLEKTVIFDGFLEKIKIPIDKLEDFLNLKIDFSIPIEDLWITACYLKLDDMKEIKQSIVNFSMKKQKKILFIDRDFFFSLENNTCVGKKEKCVNLFECLYNDHIFCFNFFINENSYEDLNLFFNYCSVTGKIDWLEKILNKVKLHPHTKKLLRNDSFIEQNKNVENITIRAIITTASLDFFKIPFFQEMEKQLKENKKFFLIKNLGKDLPLVYENLIDNFLLTESFFLFPFDEKSIKNFFSSIKKKDIKRFIYFSLFSPEYYESLNAKLFFKSGFIKLQNI